MATSAEAGVVTWKERGSVVLQALLRTWRVIKSHVIPDLVVFLGTAGVNYWRHHHEPKILDRALSAALSTVLFIAMVLLAILVYQLIEVAASRQSVLSAAQDERDDAVKEAKDSSSFDFRGAKIETLNLGLSSYRPELGEETTGQVQGEDE